MDHVYWLTEVDIRDGQADSFEALMRDMVAATRDTEPGTLTYEWSTNADRTACHLFERYEDSAAAMAHLRNFRPFAGRWVATFAPRRLTIYGSPSPEVVEALAEMRPEVLTMVDGFTR